MLAALSSRLTTIPPTKGTLCSARAHSLNFFCLPALAFADNFTNSYLGLMQEWLLCQQSQVQL